MSTLEFLKALSRNVQTTWRLACQQLSVHSARNQMVPSATNCRAPQRLEPQLARWARGCDSTAHRRVCSKLQEVHSSKLISRTLCHGTNFYKAVLGLLPPRTITQCTIPDPETSHQWHSQEKVMTTPTTRSPCPAGIIAAKLSAGSFKPLGLCVLINKFDTFSRSAQMDCIGI